MKLVLLHSKMHETGHIRMELRAHDVDACPIGEDTFTLGGKIPDNVSADEVLMMVERMLRELQQHVTLIGMKN